MSKHYHVWFYPGESYATTGTKYYLGYMLSPNAEAISRRPRLHFGGTAAPTSAGDWCDYTEGPGRKRTETLKLALEQSMFNVIGTASGYGVPIGTSEVVGGVTYYKIWLETTTDMTVDYEDYYHAFVTFADGSMNQVGPVEIENEPGTDMYILYLKYNNVLAGATTVGPNVLLPARELWWSDWMSDIVNVCGVGVLEMKYGERDADTDAVATSYCTEQYRCLLNDAESLAKLGEAPKFNYSLNVTLTRLSDNDIETSEEDTVSILNFEASDREYTDNFDLSWDDLDYATRYQIYASTDPDEDWTAVGAMKEQAADKAGFISNMTSDIEATAGLVAEILTGTSCKIGSGATKDDPGDGGYEYGQVSTEPDPSEEVHIYFWIRARVENDADDDEWTDLTGPAHGVTKAV